MNAEEREAEPAPAWRVTEGDGSGPAGPADPGPATGALLRRRELLRRGGLVGLGVLLAGGLALLADYCNPSAPVPRFGEVIPVPTHELPRPGAVPVADAVGRFWLVNLKPGAGGTPPDFEFGPAVVEGSRQGGLLALYQRCPYLGCPVAWRSDYLWGGVRGWFRCPCCGSTFTKGGVRVFGPAPRSLDTFPILVLPGFGVRVNTGTPIAGDTADPRRGVRIP